MSSTPNIELITEDEGGRTEFLGLHFDRLDQSEALATLMSADEGSPFRYLVTPNVDHMLRVVEDPAMARLYRDAWLCVNDSRVLAGLARLSAAAPVRCVNRTRCLQVL